MYRGNGVLDYLGIDKYLPEVTVQTSNPTTTNKEYDPGDIWVNKTSKEIFIMASNTNSVGTWIDVAGEPAEVDKDFISGILAVLAIGAATTTEGNRYIASATGGGWTINYIYTYHNASWVELVPSEGAMGYNHDTNGFIYWTGVAWDALPSGVTTLAALTDTTIAAAAGGDILFYDGVNSWDNKVVSGDCTAASTGAITVVSSTDMVLTTSVSGTAVLDEDDLATDSNTQIATQQSIKAYIDSGTVTMTNKTLTSPVINTDISGTAFLDEDDMASDAANKVSSQQAIKAFVTTGTVVMSAKTLTAAKIVTTDGLFDAGGDEYMIFTESATPVNYIGLHSADTTASPTLCAEGSDANIGLLLHGKGTNNVTVGDGADPTKMMDFSCVGATATKTTTLTFVHTDDRAISYPDATDTLVGKATTDILTNKSLDADGAGNVITNINMDEMDADTIPAAADASDAVYVSDGLIVAKISNQAAAVNIFNANAPFAFMVVDAYSINMSADGGTWKLNSGALGAGTDITNAITVAAVDKDIDRPTTIDDAAWAIALNGSLSIVPDGGGALDCMIFVNIVRLA